MGGFGGMSLDQIANLTDEQLVEIYFRAEEKKENGQGEVAFSYWDTFVHHWSHQGLTSEEIEAKWYKDFPDPNDRKQKGKP